MPFGDRPHETRVAPSTPDGDGAHSRMHRPPVQALAVGHRQSRPDEGGLGREPRAEARRSVGCTLQGTVLGRARALSPGPTASTSARTRSRWPSGIVSPALTRAGSAENRALKRAAPSDAPFRVPCLAEPGLLAPDQHRLIEKALKALRRCATSCPPSHGSGYDRLARFGMFPPWLSPSTCTSPGLLANAPS